jgi:prepilin-type N-terminal cleavage/methylation domain-containing protein
MNRPGRRDAGFTLIELVLTVVLMGIITLPLANFVLAYLDNYTQTETRISESHDMQTATAYFSQDVANAGVRDASGTALQSVWTSGFPAGSCGSTVGGIQVLLLAWNQYVWNSATQTADTPTMYSVGYVAVSGTLQRAFCQGSAVASATFKSSTTVVHNLYGGAATVAITCSPANCAAAPAPTTVNMQLALRESAVDSGASTALTGRRRQSST